MLWSSQTDVEESTAGTIGISVAQRYSILVTARNDTSSNWVIHANMDVDMFDTIPDALNPSKYAPVGIDRNPCNSLCPLDVTSSITYSSSADVTDSGTVDEYQLVEDISLVPIEQIAAPRPTKTIELVVIFDTMDDGTNRGTFNYTVYNSPQVPAILSALTLGENATVEQAYGPGSFVIDHMDVVDLVIKNSDAGKHPL